MFRGPGRGGEGLSSGWDRDDVGAGLWEHGKAWGAATATSKGRRKWGWGCLQTPFLTRGLTDPSTVSLQPPPQPCMLSFSLSMLQLALPIRRE